MSNKEFTQGQINKVVKWYEKGETLRVLAQTFDCNEGTIRRLLVSQGVEIRSANRVNDTIPKEIRTKYNRIVKLKAKGLRLKEIGKKEGVSRQNVSAFLKRWEGRC